MAEKIALITGITGQDGSFLTVHKKNETEIHSPAFGIFSSKLQER
jgi:GDP-D-mannose dehydratase